MYRWSIVLGVIAGCLLVPVPASAAPAGCGDATPAAVAGFFDGAVPGRLAADRVPGAVVSVVSEGKVVFAKGYGTADAERNVPFDPARSLVRIASITKLFTWTAVMQQVDTGRLDLDADVNTYLTRFQVPATYDQPVTLRTLMNHTAGFEERVVGTGARTAGDVRDLGDYLAENLPARIRPPGQVSAYSNYGAGLAGYIVAQVSGEPYDQYVRQHLFEPLAMTHSTAAEPVPAPLAGDLARSYDSDADPPRPIPFVFDQLTPDGAISTTAEDAARFMLFHLRGDAPYLARMHETSYTADPRLGGYAHGFMTRRMNGHRVLMHDGSWEGFQSALILVPGCDLGIFMSTNGTGGVATVSDLLPKFFDTFAPSTSAPDPAAAPGRPTGLTGAPVTAGFYKPARHNETTVEKLTTLLGPARLTVDGAGTVHFKGREWKPQGDGLYTRADGDDHLVFLAGPGGRRYVATDGPVYELMPAGETLPVNLVVLVAFAVAALSALLLPVVAGWRRWRRRPRDLPARWRTARWLAAGAGLLGLVFLVLLAVVLFTDTGAFLYGVPASFTALLALPVVVLLATAAAMVFTVLGWRGPGNAARVHQVFLLVGLAALAWFLWQWNLIGWQYG